MSWWKKFNPLQAWIVLYIVGLILIPPIHLGGKLFYAAEWMLVPVFLMFLYKILKHQVDPPPRELVFLIGACILTCAFGVLRKDLSQKLTMYPLPDDFFKLSRDGTKCLRWCMIFSTPWILQQTFRSTAIAAKPTQLTLHILKICTLISVGLALLEHFGLISLIDWGFHGAVKEEWAGRSYGTFASPLEAGILYGAVAVWTSVQLTTKKWMDALMILVCLLGVALTQTGTAFMAFLVTIFIYALFNVEKKIRVAVMGFLVCFLMVVVIFSPHGFIESKYINFINRSKTWIAWLKLVPQKPWIFLFGIGFSQLIVDSSFFLLCIEGGLTLLTTLTLWFKKLYKVVPKESRPIFWFWGLTWLTLDSLGYWGLGRLCWMLLGLFLIEGDLANGRRRQNS